MGPLVLAFASNASYFPGLYCAIASALSHLDPERELEVIVLDGGLSLSSRETLSGLVQRVRRKARVEFVPVDASIFAKAALGPGESYMAYCRLLLPHLLDVPRLIYLDSDVLVFRDLSKLYDLQLLEGKVLAAVPDSETLCLGEDSSLVANALHLPTRGAYFNSGVMLMNLSELRRDHFFQRAVEFLNTWSGKYRFHDQSAINFLLHERIQPLNAEWNWPAWRFDEQENNNLNWVLHYTTSAPWRSALRTPSQALFERFAKDAGFVSDRTKADFQKSRRQEFFRNAFAPFRALGFPLISVFFRIAGQKDKAEGYKKAGRYWLNYLLSAPQRRRIYRERIEEIQARNSKFVTFKSAV